jgi:hypothetical protein
LLPRGLPPTTAIASCPVGHSVIPTPLRSWRCSCSPNICREEPVFARKVTCGVRNETSGQSWPSNTVATDPFTGQKRSSKCGSGIQHKRLGGWRPKTLYLTVSNASLHWDGSTWSLELLTFLPNHGRQRPFCSRDGCGLAGFCGPVKLLCRENLALSTALSSVMSPSKVQL